MMVCAVGKDSLATKKPTSFNNSPQQRVRERVPRHIRGRPSAERVGNLLTLLGTAFEVIRAQVLIRGSVLQHVIDGGEHGSGNGYDCLLGAAPRSDAVELGLKVAALCARRGPGTLNQYRL